MPRGDLTEKGCLKEFVYMLHLSMTQVFYNQLVCSGASWEVNCEQDGSYNCQFTKICSFCVESDCGQTHKEYKGIFYSEHLQ